MLTIKEYWVKNNGVRINYLDSELVNKHIPLFFFPGMLTTAQDYVEDIKVMAPRRCLSLSLRGRGKSDTPVSGYALDDHVSDIEAVIQKTQLDHFGIFAFSMGVPYAIEYAAKHRKSIAGLIIGDFPALTRRIPETWISNVIQRFGKDKEQFAIAIQKDSEDKKLWDHLDKFHFPLLVLHGCKEGSLLKKEHIELYKKHARNIQVIAFEDSGHQIWKPDYDKLITIIKRFMDTCDKQQRTNP